MVDQRERELESLKVDKLDLCKALADTREELSTTESQQGEHHAEDILNYQKMMTYKQKGEMLEKKVVALQQEVEERDNLLNSYHNGLAPMHSKAEDKTKFGEERERMNKEVMKHISDKNELNGMVVSLKAMLEMGQGQGQGQPRPTHGSEFGQALGNPTVNVVQDTSMRPSVRSDYELSPNLNYHHDPNFAAEQNLQGGNFGVPLFPRESATSADPALLEKLQTKIRHLEHERDSMSQRLQSVRLGDSPGRDFGELKRSEIVHSVDKNYEKMASNLLMKKIKDVLEIDNGEYMDTDEDLEVGLDAIVKEIESRQTSFDELQDDCNTLRSEKIDLMEKLGRSLGSVGNAAQVQVGHAELGNLSRQLEVSLSESQRLKGVVAGLRNQIGKFFHFLNVRTIE
jgi:chromosome segregation ATPase